MKQFKNNVVKSFHMVKKDMAKLQRNIDDLTISQEKLVKALKQSRENEFKLFKKLEALTKNIEHSKKTVKIVEKPVEKIVEKVIVEKPTVIKKSLFAKKESNKKYVASKFGKKFHEENCPFAQNIKPKSKIKFNNKNDALNEGYKKCNCVA